MGNRQAALIGHRCFKRGSTKITLDDAGSVFYVTDETKIFSDNGLMTTIAYHLDVKPVYALEGKIALAGKSIKWTKKQFNIEDKDCQKKNPFSMYFVPAFHGKNILSRSQCFSMLVHSLFLTYTRILLCFL
jgi:glycerol kinase